MLTLEQVDEILKGWEERLRRVDENLLALEEDATYQILAGRAGRRASLDGVTQARVGPSLDAVSQLFDDREKLREAVEKARAVRAELSPLTFWGRDDKLAEIERLLFAPSIVLGTSVTPLAQRSLLDAGPRDMKVDPSTLLTHMSTTYDQARDTFMAVGAAWRDLEPALAAAEKQARALREEAATLFPDPGAALAELRTLEPALAAARDGVAKDPLGAQGLVRTSLDPLIQALRARLGASSVARDRARAGLVRVARRNDEVRATHARAAAAFERLLAEVELGPGARSMLVEDSLIEGLGTWLLRLDAAAAAQDWAAVHSGAERWLGVADQYEAKDKGATQRAEVLLGKRAELAGRLTARRAQAQAFAARGAPLPPEVEMLGREAEALLRQRPTPVGLAATALERYEEAVRSAATRR
jgi:hypothetical protein